jgi:hypothetical protein
MIELVLLLTSIFTPSAMPESGVFARMPRPAAGSPVYHPVRGPRRNHPRGF